MTISFTDETIIEPVEEEDPLISMNKFEFVTLEDLSNLASETSIGVGENQKTAPAPEFAYDVLGVVEDERLTVRSVTTKFGEKKQLKFKISNGRRSEKVTVWGQLANSVKDMIVEEKITPKIIILTSTKIHIYNNEVQINTMPSTKVYMNYDNEHVASMRERLEKKSQNTPSTKRIQSLQHPRTKVQYEIMDLKKLMSIKDEAYIDKEVQCRAKICKVEEDSSWWYKSCIFCKADVKQLDEEFKCTSCPKSMSSPEKRFRILVLVEDEVEACNSLLLDRAATRIVGSTATKIIAELSKVNLEDESKELQGLPKKLKDIVGKEYTFIIKFFKENILNDCGLYYASDASFSSMAVPVESVSSFPDLTIVTDTRKSDVNDDTHDTAKSTTKKPVMIKSRHFLLLDNMIPTPNSSSTNDVLCKGRKRNQTISTDDFKGTSKRPYGVSQNIPHSHSSLHDKENVSPNCNPADRKLDSRRSKISKDNVDVLPKSSFKSPIPTLGRLQNSNSIQRPLRRSPLIDCADFQRTILNNSQMRAPPDKTAQRPLRTSPLIDCADFQQTILDTSQMRAPPGTRLPAKKRENYCSAPLSTLEDVEKGLFQYFQDQKNKNNIRNTFRGTTTFSGQSEELTTKNRDRQNSDTNAMKNLMHSFNHAADNSESNQEQEGNKYNADPDNSEIREMNSVDYMSGYMDLGPPSEKCEFCDAIMWDGV
ncbi:hypothetical protein POM88_019325 [Heracleum sosnowskyi]|uniref:Replication factor A C-terminal domain-containing protein n=1 Tax=Heracleum sosnowskyi TaxID=360622 RepID=A0AAD8IS57_9APIA|nr:hypothetical protein POM88_019325 [Heracleum sosnowskyi]